MLGIAKRRFCALRCFAPFVSSSRRSSVPASHRFLEKLLRPLSQSEDPSLAKGSSFVLDRPAKSPSRCLHQTSPVPDLPHHISPTLDLTLVPDSLRPTSLVQGCPNYRPLSTRRLHHMPAVANWDVHTAAIPPLSGTASPDLPPTPQRHHYVTAPRGGGPGSLPAAEPARLIAPWWWQRGEREFGVGAGAPSSEMKDDYGVRQLVVAASGPDQPGIVSRLTKRVLEVGGNVEESRMARLAGDFTVLMLVTVDATSRSKAEEIRVRLMEIPGLHVTTRWASEERVYPGKPKKRFRQLILRGADNPGLVYNVCEYLASHFVNIEELETGTAEAPFGGTTLFLMDGIISIPPGISTRKLVNDLEELSVVLGVQIDLRSMDRATRGVARRVEKGQQGEEEGGKGREERRPAVR